MTNETTLDDTALPEAPTEATREAPLALVVLWCGDEPERAGEVLLIPDDGQPSIFGRGDAPPSSGARRLLLQRQRPGRTTQATPLGARRISREQLRIDVIRHRKLAVESAGRARLQIRGRRVAQGVVEPGDLVALEGQLLMLCTRRPPVLPGARSCPDTLFPTFGRADACGIVGESPATWLLRDYLAFVARQPGHVLVLGATGVGKELVARAVHRLSPRRDAPLLARNAATLSVERAALELFGAADNEGLLAAADGATLFLDEVAELDRPIQGQLLRLMDNGEYARVGDATTRRTDVRIIAATNRARDGLEPDFVARFRHVIAVPPLQERPEDVPLIAAHLLREAAAADPSAAERLFAEHDGATRREVPRLAPDLVAALVAMDWTSHVRQLDALLWRALAASPGDTLSGADRLEAWNDAVEKAAGPAPDAAATPDDEARAVLSKLTRTELLVMQHLALNKTSKEIAQALFVSHRTIQNHRAHICEKLDLRGPNRLLQLAIELQDALGPPSE